MTGPKEEVGWWVIEREITVPFPVSCRQSMLMLVSFNHDHHCSVILTKCCLTLKWSFQPKLWCFSKPRHVFVHLKDRNKSHMLEDLLKSVLWLRGHQDTPKCFMFDVESEQAATNGSEEVLIRDNWTSCRFLKLYIFLNVPDVHSPLTSRSGNRHQANAMLHKGSLHRSKLDLKYRALF